MFNRKYFLLALFLAFRIIVPGQPPTVTYYKDPASVPTDLPVRLEHVAADLSFVPSECLVQGKAGLFFTANWYATDSLVFSTPGFDIKKVSLVTADKVPGKSAGAGFEQANETGIPVKWELKGTSLVIRPVNAKQFIVKGKRYVISIQYEARPKEGPIYFIGWRPEEEGKRKAIWAHRPNNWLPYLDGRVTTDMYFTFDGKYTVFSNGERISVRDNPDGTRTWHYAMVRDHPYFSTSLVIGDYKFRESKTSRGVPLEYWYYSGMEDRVPVTYKYTEKMFAFFEKEIGVNYPYTQYREAPVIDYMYGGMETTTATVFGDYMLIDPHAWWQRNYVNVNAHELAHQWFGDAVAHLVNKDVWLTESFGTYYAKMFERSVYGEDYYENIRKDEMTLAFEAAAKNDYPVGGSQGGTQRIYQKGSLVLDMLRDVMGEKAFRDAVKLYTNRYLFGYAQTCDFMRAVWDATGKSYSWFFDEWILRGGEPHYKVGWSMEKDSLGKSFTVVSVSQIQEVSELKGLFRMPVRIMVYYKDGSADSAMPWIESREQKVRIPNKNFRPVAFVLFDPGRRVLKKIDFDRTPAELLAQLAGAKVMIDRFDAVQALRTVPMPVKKDGLIAAYRANRFHLVKSAILEQFARDRSPESLELFSKALQDQDASVRKTALIVLDTIPPLLREPVEKLLHDSSYLNIQFALEQLCNSFPASADRYLAVTRDMKGWRGMNIRMAWLEIAIRHGAYEFKPELVSYTGPAWEFETRMNAFAALQKLEINDPAAELNSLAASRHWNFKLAASAKAYRNHFHLPEK